ncbi:MAG: UDP-N-acetylmuramate--L-alanine ligase [Microcoleaceae cyanobacterium]
MPSYVDFSGRPFNFIGIGGIGMSALAYILAKRDLPIYGSDLRTSHITQRLESLGVHVFGDQDASNFDVFSHTPPAEPALTQVGLGEVGLARRSSVRMTEISQKSCNGNGNGNGQVSVALDLPQVICSTAIHPDNAEYKAAIALGCTIFHRSDLLAALVQEYQSVAVAGTHGKTTTSSLTAFMLLQAGLDPTVLIGGEVSAWEGNARTGHSPYMVVEADESDGSLVKLAAKVGIITNIELDHPDHYENLDQVIDIFKTFVDNCETLVGCIDCHTVREKIDLDVTYSLDPDLGADYTVDSVEYHAGGTTARVWERGEMIGHLQLQLLGRHNLQNALASVAVGRLFGLDFPTIAAGLAGFEGTRRRFEHRGYHKDILFVDDYAHHPSEIRATLSAADLKKQEDCDPTDRVPIQRVVAIFQPHRYSRTLKFLNEFAQSFDQADLVVITDVYSAGEPNLDQITGQHLANSIAEHHPQVLYRQSLDSVKALLTEALQPGDLALFLGAGNLNQIIPDVMAFYST